MQEVPGGVSWEGELRQYQFSLIKILNQTGLHMQCFHKPQGPHSYHFRLYKCINQATHKLEPSLSLLICSAVSQKMSLVTRNGYTKMDKEDPEELKHQRAQFLIHKVLEKADHSSSRRKPSFLRIRLCRLKLKIGKRFKKLRKSMLVSGVRAARVMTQFKMWKNVFFGVGDTISPLPDPHNSFS